MSKKSNALINCPCGLGDALDECRGQYIEAHKSVPTAEALMRARYTAYVFNDETYLRKTWHPTHCPVDLNVDGGEKWIGLKVVHAEAGGTGDEEGTVEFIARYKVAGKAHCLHEISYFIRHEGRWVYVDGRQ